MAVKEYSITQTYTLNNVRQSRTFVLNGADADVTALVALLEGAVKVKEVNVSLSRSTGADTNITSANFVNKISLSFDNAGDRITKYISPFNGGSIVFKNTTTPDNIRAALASCQMLKSKPTEKPKSINVSGSERMAAASTSSGS